MYGYLYHRTNEDGNRQSKLPSATRSLKGWSKRTKQFTVDPVPLACLCLLASHFASKNLIRLAMFVILGFDTYLRPSELLSLRRSDVSPPCRRAGPKFAKSWTICVAPAPEEYRTKTGLSDVTICVGDKHPIVLELFALFYRNSTSELLFPFDLDYVERHFKSGCRELGLALRITPHVLRTPVPPSLRSKAFVASRRSSAEVTGHALPVSAGTRDTLRFCGRFIA